MKNRILFAALFLITAFAANAQLGLGASVSPSISTFHTGDQSLSGTYTYPVNFGVKVSYRHQRWFFTTGLLHVTQGSKYEFLKTSEDNPEGWGEFFDVFIRARALMLPLNANYILLERGRHSFMGGAGLYTGWVYSQKQEDTSEPEGAQRDPGVNYTYSQNWDGELDVFDKLYWGLNIGLAWRYELTDCFNLQLRPNFLYQLREDQPSSTNARTNRMMSYAVDVGFFYQL